MDEYIDLLKSKILDLAMKGKLVKQEENDEPASVLIDRIIEEKHHLMKEGKIRKEKLSKIYKDASNNNYYEKFDNGKILDITEEIPFEIPANWCWSRIGVIEEINLGFTYRPDYTEEGVYFLSVKDISGGKINFSEAKKVSQETYNNAYYGSKPYRGDILFGRVGTIGKPQIITTDIPFCIFVSLGFFRDYLNIINKEYICSWMESDLFKGQVKLKVKGTAQINLNTGWLKNFLIPIPPIKEQERISKNIGILFDNINQINESKNKIDEYKKILKEKILDLAIKGELLKQNKNEKSADILINTILDEKRNLIETKQIKKQNLSKIYKDNTDNKFYEKFENGKVVNITEEIPFEIPDNWRWTRLNCICTKIVDGDHNPPQGQNYKTNYIMLSAKNIQNDKLINLEQARYLTKEDYENGKNRISLKNEDILLTIVGTLGRSCIYKDSGINILFQRSVAVITTLINNEFLKLVLDSSYIQRKMNYEAKGTAQRGFYLNQLEKILIPIPSLEEQLRIISKCKQFLKLIK